MELILSLSIYAATTQNQSVIEIETYCHKTEKLLISNKYLTIDNDIVLNWIIQMTDRCKIINEK